MSDLRTPFVVLALVLIGLAVLVELGASLVVGGADAGSSFLQQVVELDVEDVDLSDADIDEPPGRALTYLVLIDGILLYTVLLITVSLVVPERLQARLQGILTLIGSIILIIVAIILAIIALVELIVMVSLFLAPPWGTLGYLAIWGFFPRGDAAALLSLLMLLKLGFAACLVLAHQRFLQLKGLVLLVITSLLANIIISFLHGFVPVILVSITDDIAAIIVAVIAIIWGIVLLIGSIPAVVQTVRVSVSTD